MSTVPYAMRASPSKSCGGKLGAPFDPTLRQGEVAAMWKSPPPAFWNRGSLLMLPPPAKPPSTSLKVTVGEPEISAPEGAVSSHRMQFVMEVEPEASTAPPASWAWLRAKVLLVSTGEAPEQAMPP